MLINKIVNNKLDKQKRQNFANFNIRASFLLTKLKFFCIISKQLNLGEWLNGRVAVSKTVGCVFESRLPCHIVPNHKICDLELFYYKINFKSFKPN